MADEKPSKDVETFNDSIFWQGTKRHLQAACFTNDQIEELIDMVDRVVEYKLRKETDHRWDDITNRLSDRVSHDVMKKLFSEGKNRYQWTITLLVAVCSSVVTLLVTLLYLQS